MNPRLLGFFVLLVGLGGGLSLRSAEVTFDRVVIDDDFPGAYQVEVADVNGDKKPDIIAVGGGTCAWYENPSWKKRLVSTPKETPGIITSATADFDGDGQVEVAIGYDFSMNEPSKGKLALALQGASIEDPWTITPVGDVPSIHRLRSGDLDRDGKLDLVVAPIFGPKTKPPTSLKQIVEVRIYTDFGRGADRPEPLKFRSGNINHAIDVADVVGDGRLRVLMATDLGIKAIFWGRLYANELNDHWVVGHDFTADTRRLDPTKQGASEVHVGRMSDGKCLLVTIEPWHGNQVCATTSAIHNRPEIVGPYLDRFGPATVIDDTLDDGHALWTADIDGDGASEIFAGHRGKDHRVSMYRFDGTRWQRTVIDENVAAQDLRGGDIDGNGAPDVVAVGGSTHNVVLYRFLPPGKVTSGD